MNRKLLLILLLLIKCILNFAVVCESDLFSAIKKRLGTIRQAMNPESDENNGGSFDDEDTTQQVKQAQTPTHSTSEKNNDIVPMGKNKFKEMQQLLLKSAGSDKNAVSSVKSNNVDTKAEEFVKIPSNPINHVRLILEFLSLNTEWCGNDFLVKNALDIDEKNTILEYVIKNKKVGLSKKDILEAITDVLPARFFDEAYKVDGTIRKLHPKFIDVCTFIPSDDFYNKNASVIGKLIKLIDDNRVLKTTSKDVSKQVKSNFMALLSVQ